MFAVGIPSYWNTKVSKRGLETQARAPNVLLRSAACDWHADALE